MAYRTQKFITELTQVLPVVGHKEFVQFQGFINFFVTIQFFVVKGCWPHAQPPRWRTTPRRMSTTAYSIDSQLTSITGGCSSIRNLKDTMLWWQGPTKHGFQGLQIFNRPKMKMKVRRIDHVVFSFYWNLMWLSISDLEFLYKYCGFVTKCFTWHLCLAASNLYMSCK